MKKNIKKFYQNKKKQSNQTIDVQNISGEENTRAEIVVQNKIDYTPKISVVMPVYNVEPYLKECLDSVTSQTLKEIEILCVDDGSTDNSLKVLKEYALRDKRITLCAQSHIGSGKCRNIALSLAKGEYIGFVDPDDFIEKDYFQKLYNATLETSPDIVFQTSRIEFYPTDGRKIIISTPRNENEIAFRLNVIQSAAHLWSKIFKADFVNKYNLRNSYTRRSQDTMFTIPAILFAKEIKCIDNAQYYYRKGHVSVTSKSYWMPEDVAEQFDLYQNLEEKITRYKPEYAFFIKYKRNIIFKKIYEESSEELRKVIADKIGMDYFTDFECVTSKAKTIAIKNPSPAKIDKIWWGDYWLGLDLEQGLKQEGFNARLDCFDEWKSAAPADINFVIRGPRAFNNFNYDKINILYLMSIVKSYEEKELDNYDIIIVASERFKKIRKDKKVYYLPQFTNPYRFYQEIDKSYKTDILFVGNAYWDIFRKSVKYSVENNFPISVYGKFWENMIDPKYIKGTFIDNNRLHKYYSNAAIVLNDTADEMRENGIISNRIFDVTACKGFIISDYVPEIKKLYGDSVPMYKNEKEFVSLISYYLDHPEERREKAQKAYEITMAHCTNRIFAQKLHEIINGYKKEIPHLDYKYLLSDWYKRTTGSLLNLNNPRTFNEKIQWLKLYDSTPIKTKLADKYLVRDWVKEKIGEEYLIPLLGVYDKLEDIDFKKLPNQFVIKCNHGCGYNIIVKDKSVLNLEETENKLNKWMNENFAFKAGYELHYRDIKPKIIIEKFIENEGTNDLYDYKFWCFGGKVKYIQFLSERNLDGLKMAFYDTKWNKQKFVYDHPLDTKTIQKPDNLDLMINLAENLAKDFNYVRVDFYRLNNGQIYFGEMTFTSASGTCGWSDAKINKYLGSLIKLPKLAYDIDKRKYIKAPKQNILKTGLFNMFCLWQELLQKIKLTGSQIKAIEQNIQKMRVDVKNVGHENNAVEINAPQANILEAPWLKNAQGSGQIVESSEIKQKLSIKTIKDGKLQFVFRGRDKRNGKGVRLPVWIDYKSIKIDGKEILEKPVETWHDKPYRYEMEVKDGQTVNVEIKQIPHQYGRGDLRVLIKVFYPNLSDLDNISRIVHRKFDRRRSLSYQLFHKKTTENAEITYICGIKVFKKKLKKKTFFKDKLISVFKKIKAQKASLKARFMQIFKKKTDKKPSFEKQFVELGAKIEKMQSNIDIHQKELIQKTNEQMMSQMSAKLEKVLDQMGKEIEKMQSDVKDLQGQLLQKIDEQQSVINNLQVWQTEQTQKTALKTAKIIKFKKSI